MKNIENIKIKICSDQTEFWGRGREHWNTVTYELREGTIGELSKGPNFLTDDVNEYFKKSAQECIETKDLEHFLERGHETIETDYNIWIFPSLVE